MGFEPPISKQHLFYNVSASNVSTVVGMQRTRQAGRKRLIDGKSNIVMVRMRMVFVVAHTGAGYSFIGPDCVFVGGPSGHVSMVKWRAEGGRTANVMLFAGVGTASTLTGQTSADALVTITPKASSAVSMFERRVASEWIAAANAAGGWQGLLLQGRRVEGRVGEVRWFQDEDGPCVQIEALEGEKCTVHLGT